MSVAEYTEEIEEIRNRYKNYINNSHPAEVTREATDGLKTLVEDVDKIEQDESVGSFHDNDLCQTLDFHYAKLEAIDDKAEILSKSKLSK